MFHGSVLRLRSAKGPAESFFHMHRLKATLKTSVMALLGQTEISSSMLEERTEDVREFILDELGESGQRTHPQVVRRVRYAKDIQELWYMRGSIMTVLSAMHGETLAREKLERISDQFKGLLPHGLSSRPSPLSS